MDIILLILIMFFAVSVMIVARVIINRRRRLRESKKEEEKVRKEQEKRRQEEERKRLEEEQRRREEEERRLAEERRRKEEEERNRLEEERRRKEELEKIKAEEEKIEQEAREKAAKEKAERERLEAEEKENKAEQEAKARKAEEEKAGKEEVKKKEELERRLKGEEEKTRLEKFRRREEEEKQELVKRPPPGKRGGRPRGSTKKSGTERSLEPKPRSPKPEIICWDEGGVWIVGIEVPEKFETSRVAQNDELLEQDTSDDSLYPLKHIEGRVKVAWTAGEQDGEIDIPIMDEGRNYLVFKMRKDWKGLGRLVRRPTAGYYLIIAPQEWERHEETSGTAPVAPEKVQINGYKAHFFVLRQNEDTAVAFINAKSERIQVETGSSRFQLVGKEISDSSEDMGPLFGEEPPRIKTIDEREWRNVGMVVVGEEGGGRNRWRTQFIPEKGANEQKMPDELTNQQGGWYFVRIYDNNDDLLESMDFRFITGLKGIQIVNSKPLPEPDGYNDVIVQFIHQANCKVEPMDEEMFHALTIRRENDLTIITIPPRPDYDKTHWILSDRNAKVKVTVLVERVWWCVGRLGVVPANWTGKTVSLSRKDFTAITDEALWVKFPRKRWISKIEVGFNRTKSRYYNVEVENEEIAVPLRDFCDAEEIQNKQEEFAMKIWVSSDGTKTYEAIVLKIPAEVSPPVEQKPPRVKPLPPRKLEAEVKTRRGKRKGKGFSRNEVANAGLTMEDVKCLHIPYDKRRKSSHSWNMERLKFVTKR